MPYIFTLMFFIALFAIEYLATTTIEIKPLEGTWDKANHFIAFFTLYILLIRSSLSPKITTAIILLILFGFQIEIVQSFLPPREFSLLDVVADTIGIIVAIFINFNYNKYKIFFRKIR